MTRVCITGGPRTGKTTLAQSLAAPTGRVVHCDCFIGMGWSEASEHVAGLMLAPGPFLVEGVQIPRALRKALAARPDAKPCDRLIVLSNEPHEPWTPGQARMAKGVDTVLAEILPALRRLGVEIEERT